MDENKPLMPEGEPTEKFVDMVEDMISDPETRGFTICSAGPRLEAVAQTISDGQYETHVALCAVMLKEHVEGFDDDVDAETFLKDVVNEFNERRVSSETGTEY